MLTSQLVRLVSYIVNLVAPEFRMCFTVDLTNDSKVEGTERFIA